MGTKPKIVAAAEAAATEQVTPTSAAAPAPAMISTTTTTPTAIKTAGARTAPDSISKSMEKAMKSTEELFAFGQGNVEAIMKASQIWATGLQDLTKQVAATAQANLDETMNSFKTLSTAKSFKDAIDLQTGFARSAFEKSMTESGKLTDASFKLAEQALAPITARMTQAMDAMVKAA